MNNEKRCFDCAMCSEHYPSFKDICDVDDHEISDVYSELCDKFIEMEEQNEIQKKASSD